MNRISFVNQHCCQMLICALPLSFFLLRENLNGNCGVYVCVFVGLSPCAGVGCLWFRKMTSDVRSIALVRKEMLKGLCFPFGAAALQMWDTLLS